MQTAAFIVAMLVALEHFFIMGLEMFLSNSHLAQKSFHLDHEFVQDQRVQILFKNQGLYNGFLAAGIVWGIFSAQLPVVLFFVVCVVIAAVYGAVTSLTSILWKQRLPALLALILLAVAMV
jgi:putative membrane protein